VFLSYRRDDTRHLSARIYEQLERHFGEGHVFFDVDTLPRYAGWDFEDVIRETVPQCRVFLAIIGRDWARLMRARLREPKDFVQIELAIALNTPGVRVIPVLVDGAAMPVAADLPEALRGLLGKQNVVLPPDPHLRQAVNDLAKTLLAAPAQPIPPPPARPAAPPLPPRVQPPSTTEPPTPTVGIPKWLMPAGAAGLALMALLIWSPWNRSNPSGADAPPNVAEMSAPEAAGPAPPAETPTPAASFVDARTTPASTRAPLVRNPSSLPDYALFRECDGCPEMVVIPGGSFLMGSPAGEAGRGEDEDSQAGAGGSQVSVRLPRFAISRFETSWDEWAACVSAGVCQQREDSGFGRGRRPVINVDWETDTRAFVRFVNSRASGYRLLSEAEWEYAARAGTTTTFSLGNGVRPEQAQYWWSVSYNGSPTRTTNPSGTAPVGSFEDNAWGVYDMHGNVWEWVEDCYRDNLSGRTAAANTTGDCSLRVLRGGSWGNDPDWLRSAYRIRSTSTGRYNYFGFRLARTL
jgi:formylglycine-generating enzyme required for sulfatase activity